MKLAVVVIDIPGNARGHWSRDLGRLLCGTLGTAGYDCILTRNQPAPDRLNVVVGGHWIGGSEHLQAFTPGPVRYVVVQVQHLLAPEIMQGQAAVQFQKLYLPLLAGAVAIWEAEPMRLPVLQALGLHGTHLPLGFDPISRVLPQKLERDIDFCFFGTITPHRQRLLLPLQQRGHSLQVVKTEDPFFRNDVLARTRVHLAPLGDFQTRRVPVVRLAMLLANRCLVVAEQGANHHQLEDCLVLAPVGRWVEVCEETLARPDREELRCLHADRFEQRPMSDLVRPLVEGLV